jgi:hypothetical protein
MISECSLNIKIFMETRFKSSMASMVLGDLTLEIPNTKYECTLRL